MNYYFLLEDEKSFIKVLPKWLEYMGFQCSRVADIKAVTNHCYVMQSGQGVTRLITKALYDTMDTILVNPGKIRYSKNRPDYVLTDTYFNAIVGRMRRTSHINSFKV